MVLSDGMVHFLKIEKKFNKSTKTILWLSGLSCDASESFEETEANFTEIFNRASLLQDFIPSIPIIQAKLGKYMKTKQNKDS